MSNRDTMIAKSNAEKESVVRRYQEYGRRWLGHVQQYLSPNYFGISRREVKILSDTTSIYSPHQGNREKARRLRQFPSFNLATIGH